MTASDRKPKKITPWTTVALLLGFVALASAIEQPPERHYQAARAALAKGDTDKAKRELKLSLQGNPLHAPSHFLLAELLGREGDLDQATVGFQQTVTLEPNNALARYNLGTAMLWRGEPVAAARQLEDALSVRPDHVPTYNNLAKAYFLAGLPELALAASEEALRRDPTNTIALKNRQRLTAAAGNHVGAVTTGVPPVAPPPPIIPASQPATAENPEVNALRELLHDLPHVKVEQRGGRLTLAGWTSSTNEQKLLQRIHAGLTAWGFACLRAKRSLLAARPYHQTQMSGNGHNQANRL